jgi:hypothetical protein
VDFVPEALDALLKQSVEPETVFWAGKNILPIVSAQHNVAQRARTMNSRVPCHGTIMPQKSKYPKPHIFFPY